MDYDIKLSFDSEQEHFSSDGDGNKVVNYFKKILKYYVDDYFFKDGFDTAVWVLNECKEDSFFTVGTEFDCLGKRIFIKSDSVLCLRIEIKLKDLPEEIRGILISEPNSTFLVKLTCHLVELPSIE